LFVIPIKITASLFGVVAERDINKSVKPPPALQAGLNILDIASCPTTHAQRPGVRDATIATMTPPPDSVQRMILSPKPFWFFDSIGANGRGVLPALPA
jgi:hypothetical protein